MMRYAWPPISRWTMFFLLACGLTACTAFKPQLTPPGPASDLPPRKAELARVNYLGVPCYLHAVRWPEETLSAIARWYTGSSRNARILAKVTPNLREGDLRKGDVVFVPLEISRRSDPMPHSYARRYGQAPPSATPAAPPNAPPDLNDDFPADRLPPSPYGPRTFPE